MMICQSMRCSTSRRWSGFTLVELLVVIVIIGILIGLLIPVLGIARAHVQEAAISAEVASLSHAVQAFKTQYQTEFPPDFSGPIALGGGQAPFAFDAASIDEFMGRIYRYRNRATDVPRNPDGTVMVGGATLYQNLDPAEALWFWLRGFSDDPANPLWGPENTPPDAVQRTPLFDFDKSRLIDKDGDGFPEYYPRFASDLPYVYLVHYNYVGAFQVPTFRARSKGPTDTGGASFMCPRPYLEVRAEPGEVSPNYFLQTNNYAAPDKFQIIAAGLDNSFGLQIDLNSFRAFTFPLGPYPDKPHLDNVTNFAEGTLEKKLP